MSYTPSMRQLRGLSYEVASLYGMPHIGCEYYREEMDATRWTGADRRCAVCGKGGRNWHSRHHEPPRSKGSFLLSTPKGAFVLLPALIDLCGSGTTGCHGMRHNGLLRIRWAWDDDESAAKWWDGTLLSQPYQAPHGEWLYEHGRYVFEVDGKRWEYRG